MKRIVSLLLCLVLVAGVSATVRADNLDIGQTWDDSILAGGIYDLYVWVSGDHDDYTYQWQADAAFGKGSWMDLQDNANPYGYRGTNTYHMEFITGMNDGQIIGTGWEDIPFRCVVTDKKTGASRATPNMYMRIFTSSDLDDLMKEKGIELYMPRIEGVPNGTTSDHKTYYSTAQAGKNLRFVCGFKPPQNDPFFGRSELKGNVEVWITEDGKTVKREDGGTYTPYTVGKNTVTAQFKLHYSLGIHDLGYYETKTIYLSTTAPDTVGYATARSQISLLKEQYNESQKLTSIPKGTKLNVTGRSGGWYQVVHNGYIGYVATSAVDFKEASPAIDHVNVNIAEPVAGNLPATSATVTPDSCTFTSAEWEDKTEGRYMKTGERFQKGHDYQLVVWVTAKEDYEFKLDSNDTMLTTATINGTRPAYTSRAYEQIIGKVIDIRYDFINVRGAEEQHVCKPAQVSRVAPTCTKAGRQAYYQCGCGKTYADSAATQPIDLSTWGVLPATGHTEGGWSYNGTHHYKKCTLCREVITGTNAPHAGGTATCLQKAVCTACGMQYGQVGDHKWSPKHHPVDAKGHAYQCADCKTYDVAQPHTPGPEATDTEPQKCTLCQYIITPAKDHVHRYLKNEAKAATCLTPGSLEYYTCDGCSQWWSDGEGKTPIPDPASVILPALGHFTRENWECDPQTHWQSCVVCMTVLEEGRGDHSDSDGDGKCDLCGYSADVPLPTETPEELRPQETTQTPSGEKKSGGNNWLILLLVALVSFSAAVTATVIILKKKG